MTSERLHGTAVSLGGRGVLIEGPPGSGKSDLALRLIDRGAKLISDDQVVLERHDDAIHAHALPGFEGRIEARGLGIVNVAHVRSAPVRLCVELSAEHDRLPERTERKVMDIAVPCVRIDPARHAAPIFVELALNGDVLPLD